MRIKKKCGESGHFKWAPSCMKPKPKKTKTKQMYGNKDKIRMTKSRSVQDKESSDSNTKNTDEELTDSCSRLTKQVCRSTQPNINESRVSLKARANEGEEYQVVKWLSDSLIMQSLY